MSQKPKKKKKSKTQKKLSKTQNSEAKQSKEKLEKQSKKPNETEREKKKQSGTKQKKKKNLQRVKAGKLAKEHSDKSERDIARALCFWMAEPGDVEESHYLDGNKPIAKTFQRRLEKSKGRLKKGLGDIKPPERFGFEIECKSVQEIDLYGLILARTGRKDGKAPEKESNKIWRWLEQAEKQAKKALRSPMLIFNENTKKHLVGLPIKTAKLLYGSDFVNIRGKFGIIPFDKMLQTDYNKFTMDYLIEQLPKTNNAKIKITPEFEG